jgi:hypothetical protein
MSGERTLEEQCYGECWAAKERIAELNASLAEAWLTNATLRADLARVTAERDEARRLLKSVVDVVQESMLPTQPVPNHICGYALRPDIGVCKVCEDFTDALAMIYPDEFKEEQR